MIELVIKISKEEYKSIKNDVKKVLSMPNHKVPLLYKAVNEATPLPEHHGRLIDADAIPRHLVRDIDEIDKQPTIIEGSGDVMTL